MGEGNLLRRFFSSKEGGMGRDHEIHTGQEQPPIPAPAEDGRVLRTIGGQDRPPETGDLDKAA